MRSLVIDDEADARARLIRLLGAHPEVAVIGEAQDGLDAIEKIEELRPDLLFLDIEMPGLKGFEVLRSIPAAIEIPLVIFTTGYDQHALAAFEANALAYLLKPIDPERLSFAIERSRKLCSLSGKKKGSARTFCARQARHRRRFARSSAGKTDAHCLCLRNKSSGSRCRMASCVRRQRKTRSG